MQRFFFIFILFLLVTGCYQTSLAPMLGPAVSIQQGQVAYSAASTGINYGVKYKTGKFPLEHIIKKEKEKIVKKIDMIEDQVLDKSQIIKDKIVKRKESIQIQGKSEKKRWVLHLHEIKNFKQEEAFPANKPRYSYWSKRK